MLRERRGQQASQERNSERVLFPKLMERTSEALFQQRTLYWGSSRREAGEANTSFQSATKAVVARGQDELRKGLFIQCCWLKYTRLSMSFSCLQWGAGDGVPLLCDQQWWNILFRLEVYWLGYLVYSGVRQSRYSPPRWATHHFHLGIVVTTLGNGCWPHYLCPRLLHLGWEWCKKHVRFSCLWWLISSLETAPLINAPWSRGGQAS